MDGGAISGSITGFENVDLAGYTGGGAAVTAIKTGSTITGTGSTDRITGGAGNDTIRIVQTANLDSDVVVGGAGTDTLLVIDGLANATLAQNVIDLTTPGNGKLANIGAFANYSGIENVDVSAEAGDGFTITGSAANNSIKGGAGKDSITMGAGGTNTVDAGDGADVIVFGTGTDTLVISAVGDVEAANKAVTNNAGGANVIAATDTIALGAALTAGTSVVEVITTFTTLTDKIDLSAFGLTGTAAASSDGGTGNDVNIANGKFDIIRGAVAAGTGVFTVNNTGADSLLIFDGDTSGAVSVVGVVIDAGVAVAGDLILA
jgi:Ca2+-binding RTX toxin-like protein